ncbi:MAG: hypothetical protein Ct9H300mP12_03920 [Acidimicrobiales bacterium]|nr:MAG: hypothetical protein Ct9H300mP12_03920 [Acidimicrobiales bacterium]
MITPAASSGPAEARHQNVADSPGLGRTTGPVSPGHEATAAGLIRDAANPWEDRVLVILDDQRVTYRRWSSSQPKWPALFPTSGVTRGTRLGLLAPNGPDWVVAWLAATRIGAVTTLLSTYLRPRELSWALGHSGVEVLVTADGYLGRRYPEDLETAIPDLAFQRRGGIEIASHPDRAQKSMCGTGPIGVGHRRSRTY